MRPRGSSTKRLLLPLCAGALACASDPLDSAGGDAGAVDTAAGIDGMGAAEGDALLGELLEWATQPELLYHHDWRVGDLVMWDNTSTMHSRDAFSPTERRMLKRTGFEFTPEQAVPV